MGKKYEWLEAAGLTHEGLTSDEAGELDTLVFIKNCDLPFGDKEQHRINELKRKTER